MKPRKLYPDWKLRPSTLFCLLFLPCLLISDHSFGQNYPKLYVDGQGLAITAFTVQTLSGNRWVNTDSYAMNKKYRFNARFTNFYPAGLAYNMESMNKRIAGIAIIVGLGPAKFDSNGRNNLKELLLRCESGYGGCPDVIQAEKSKWMSFGNFTWMGPPSKVSQFPVDIEMSHQEIILVKPASKAKITPTS